MAFFVCPYVPISLPLLYDTLSKFLKFVNESNEIDKVNGCKKEVGITPMY